MLENQREIIKDEKLIDDISDRIEKIKLLDASPKYYKEYKPYASILKQKINDQSIKNIGIVAPYGAGKSSLIKTFVDEEKKANKKIENQILTISLANFNSIKDTFDKNQNKEYKEERKEKNNKNQLEHEIEKSLLQQLFYKNNNKKTKSSRFKVLKDSYGSHIFFTIIAMILIISICLTGLNYFEISKQWIYWATIPCMIVALSFLIYFVLRGKYLKKIEIGKLKLDSIESDNNDSSILNLYLDEILYFFQKNKLKLVFIEDLDRFDDLLVFSKLRELNNLLNSNEQIRKKLRKITFIYAVKDSMFENEEQRSKFFDFILPVIPSITTENIKDEFIRSLTEALKSTEKDLLNLDNQMIIEVADYISNRRILNNVINDYLIHSSLLNIKDNNHNKLNKLFVLMILKNIEPLEYEMLQSQNKKSAIIKLLNDKKSEIIKEKKLELENNNKIINQSIENNRKEMLGSFEELKYLCIGIIIKEFNNYSYYENALNNLKTFEGVKEIKSTQYYASPIEIQEINKFLPDNRTFEKIEQNFKNKIEIAKNELLKKRQINLQKISTLENLSMAELFDIYPEILDVLDFNNNNFIKLVLTNGYIDETHMDFLSNRSNHFISFNDSEIIRKINRKEKLLMTEEINDPTKVTLQIAESRFKYENILNFYLIDNLFKEKEKFKNQIENFGDTLVRCPESCIKFLETCINSFEIEEVKDLLLNWSFYYEKLWFDIVNSSFILDEIKKEIFKELLNSLDLNIIKKQNFEGSFINYLNKMTDFIETFDSKKISINELLNSFKIKFEKIEVLTKNECAKVIIENCSYQINFNNLKIILNKYYDFDIDIFENKMYEAILKVETIHSYVLKEIDSYVYSIYSEISSSELAENEILELLLNKKITIENRKLVIEKEINKFNYNTELNLDLIFYALKINKIVPSIENILNIFDKLNLELDKKEILNKTMFIDFIDNNYEFIELSKEVLMGNNEFRSFFWMNINLSLYKDKVGTEWFDIRGLNESTIKFLITYEKCKYCLADFKIFLKNQNVLNIYCKSFHNDIFEELTKNKANIKPEETIQLTVLDCVNLYFALSKTSTNLYEYICRLINKEIFNEIMKKESSNDYYDNNEKYLDILRLEIKLELLNSGDINKLNKANILCHLKELENDKFLLSLVETFPELKNETISFPYQIVVNECRRRKISVRYSERKNTLSLNNTEREKISVLS